MSGRVFRENEKGQFEPVENEDFQATPEKNVLRETESGFVIESDVEVSKVTPVGIAETPIEDVPMEDLKKIRLSRKRTVMTLDTDLEPVDGFASFTAKDDDGLITSSYLMSEMDYEAFGSPEIITVGIVTGDILNG